jgi:hypothetical protein
MPKTGGVSPTRKARTRLEGRRRAVMQGWQACGLTDRMMGRPVFGVAGERGPRAPLPSCRHNSDEPAAKSGRRLDALFCETHGVSRRQSNELAALAGRSLHPG